MILRNFRSNPPAGRRAAAPDAIVGEVIGADHAVFRQSGGRLAGLGCLWPSWLITRGHDDWRSDGVNGSASGGGAPDIVAMPVGGIRRSLGSLAARLLV
jgi:hypothetical protein